MTPEGKREYLRQWRLRNPEKVRERARRQWLQRKTTEREKRRDQKREYNTGWTRGEVLAALKTQEYRCALPACGTTIDEQTANADHCHVIGIKRGLLCHRCNTGLGLFRDNTSLLADAIKYLVTTHAIRPHDVPGGGIPE